MQDINSIIYNNIGLVKAQLKRFNLLLDPDAESLAYEALYNAVSTFDATKGYKLSTYATCCIFNALGSYIRALNKKRQLEVVSYNNIAYTEEGSQYTYIDFIQAPIPDVDHGLLQKELCSKVNKAYEEVFNSLSNKTHIAIVAEWHKADYDISNKAIADIVGVSQPYVNQILSMVKNIIKKKLEEYYYG